MKYSCPRRRHQHKYFTRSRHHRMKQKCVAQNLAAADTPTSKTQIQMRILGNRIQRTLRAKSKREDVTSLVLFHGRQHGVPPIALTSANQTGRLYVDECLSADPDVVINVVNKHEFSTLRKVTRPFQSVCLMWPPTSILLNLQFLRSLDEMLTENATIDYPFLYASFDAYEPEDRNKCQTDSEFLESALHYFLITNAASSKQQCKRKFAHHLTR